MERDDRALSAKAIIELLGLQAHLEGGHYRETFRDVAAPASSEGRAASTAIYFLLQAGEVSRWHRVDAAEVWHWYAGAALQLTTVEGGKMRSILLGSNLLADQRPQAVVPAHVWQQAQSLGPWTLVGCTVAPGFQFSGFELAPAEFQPLS